MKRLTPGRKLNRPRDLVEPVSAAHEGAAIPFSPNTPQRRRTTIPACRRGRHNLCVTAQNRPKLTIFDHPKRTIPSAQLHFRRNTRQILFSPRPHPGEPPSTTGQPTAVQDRPELTKPDHPDRTISSAQQYFRQNTPENFFVTDHPTERTLDPQPTVRQAPYAINHNRTDPNTAERPNAACSALSSTSDEARPKFSAPRTL